MGGGGGEEKWKRESGEEGRECLQPKPAYM